MANIRSLVSFDHCKILLPWFAYAKGNSALDKLRREALRLERADALTPSLAQLLVASILYPLRILRESFCAFGVHGRHAQRIGGGSTIKLFIGSWYCSLRYNLGPRDYYIFRLWNRPLAEWSTFIPHRESTRVLIKLRDYGQSLAIWSKLGWWRFCKEQQLPTVPIVADADQHSLTFHVDEDDLCGRDLFLKPNEDYSSRGAVMLAWTQKESGWTLHGAREGFVGLKQLSNFLREEGKKNPIVLQVRHFNHPAIEGIAKNALANARVISARLPFL